MDTSTNNRWTGWLSPLPWLVVLVIALCVIPQPGQAEELIIAAASDLNFAFKELVSVYEQHSGSRIKLTLGSSGNFFSQIEQGAPFDLFFSADIRYPEKLIEAGRGVESSLYTYAVGRIVLWVPNGSPVPIEKGLDALTASSVRKVSIANPKHAPYGRAAVSAMEHYGVYDRIKSKLVLGENISQAAQFADSGATDAGIIALSLALAPTMKARGRYWEIPADAHPPLAQAAIVLTQSRRRAESQTFLEFVKSSFGRAIMERYGFVVPQ